MVWRKPLIRIIFEGFSLVWQCGSIILYVTAGILYGACELSLIPEEGWRCIGS